MGVELGVSFIVPRNGSACPASPSLPRVPAVRFPVLCGTTARSAPSFPSRVASFPSLGGTTSRPLSSQGQQALLPCGLGLSSCPSTSSRGGDEGLPGSWGALTCACPVLRPRRDPRCLGRWRHLGCCLPNFQLRRLSRVVGLGARSHGLHTRCLRFAVVVTQGAWAPERFGVAPAAQDSLPAGGLPLPGGIRYPQGSKGGFSSSFPSSRLRLAQ
jgi:hypothetical protein